MPIRNLARDAVVSASGDTTVTELARLMRDENVGSVVVTDDGSSVGIVTDRDLAIRVLADDADADRTAADVMSTDLCTIDPEAGFYEAAETMRDNGVRRLPVCTDGNELTGIITADDLTELLAEEQEMLAEVVRAQRPPY